MRRAPPPPPLPRHVHWRPALTPRAPLPPPLPQPLRGCHCRGVRAPLRAAPHRDVARRRREQQRRAPFAVLQRARGAAVEQLAHHQVVRLLWVVIVEFGLAPRRMRAMRAGRPAACAACRHAHARGARPRGALGRARVHGPRRPGTSPHADMRAHTLAHLLPHAWRCGRASRRAGPGRTASAPAASRARGRPRPRPGERRAALSGAPPRPAASTCGRRQVWCFAAALQLARSVALPAHMSLPYARQRHQRVEHVRRGGARAASAAGRARGGASASTASRLRRLTAD